MRGRYVTVIGYAFQSVHSGLLYPLRQSYAGRALLHQAYGGRLVAAFLKAVDN